jgi:Flp pilus assembly protein TadD
VIGARAQLQAASCKPSTRKVPPKRNKRNRRRGDTAAAIDAYTRWAELEPSDGRAWSNLAQAWLCDPAAPGAAAAALGAARRAVEADKGAPKPRFRLAAALAAAGLYAEAAAAFKALQSEASARPRARAQQALLPGAVQRLMGCATGLQLTGASA